MTTSITRSYTWAMGHRLQHHEGLCRNPHGHGYKAEVTVTGPMSGSTHTASEQDMVMDFSDLDGYVKAVIEPWDHAMMLDESDPVCRALEELTADWSRGFKLVKVQHAPTAERIAERLAVLLSSRLPHYVTVVRVRLWETERSFAEWERAL